MKTITAFSLTLALAAISFAQSAPPAAAPEPVKKPAPKHAAAHQHKSATAIPAKKKAASKPPAGPAL